MILVDARHEGEEHGVIGVAICAGMNTAVAVWRDNNESRVIRSTIVRPTDIGEAFKIGTSDFTFERCQRCGSTSQFFPA